MLRTISSISPRVFIRIPRLAAAREARPVTRAAMKVPPNLPAVATRTIRAQMAQLDAPDTRSIRVRMPANAKNAGSRRIVTTTFERSMRTRARPLWLSSFRQNELVRFFRRRIDRHAGIPRWNRCLARRTDRLHRLPDLVDSIGEQIADQDVGQRSSQLRIGVDEGAEGHEHGRPVAKGPGQHAAIALSKPLEAPIERPVQAPEEIAVRASVRSPDEIGTLGRSLNVMAGRLREKIDDLEREQAKATAILDAMVEGVIATDGHDHIFLLNEGARGIFGLGQTRVERRPLLEVIRNVDLHGLLSESRAAADGYVRMNAYVLPLQYRLVRRASTGVAVVRAAIMR